MDGKKEVVWSIDVKKLIIEIFESKFYQKYQLRDS